MLRRPWLRVALLGIGLVVFGAGGFTAQRLGGLQHAMYDPSGVVDAKSCRPNDAYAGTIVYTALRPGNLDLYLFEGAGVAPRRITDHGNLDYNPAFSPDGRWVVFTSDRGGATNLYALDLEAGGEPVALTTHPAMDDAAAVSPDGRSVAFVSTRSGSPDVFIMPFAPGDPSAEAQAVNLTRSRHGDFNPVFSPDGSRIAFSSNRGRFHRWNPLRLVPESEGIVAIYAMDLDGSRVRRMASGLGIVGSPAWTADGASILYHKVTGPRASAVYRKPLRGRAVRLSPDGMMALSPTAGPDGTVIFAGIEARESGPALLQPAGGRLYRVAPDGSGLEPMTEAGRTWLGPRYNAASGRLVAYGDGPVDDAARMANGTPFTWPDAVRTVRLGDGCVRLRAVRSYFPSMAETGDHVVAIPWVHEANGAPPGPAPIISAAADGTHQMELFPAHEEGFAWSPVVTRDGEWVFFAQGPRFGAPDANVGIWKVRVDGTDAVHLTADSDANDAFPDISADGRQVVFRSGRDGAKEIYVMDADGGGVRRVSHTTSDNTMPAISPDGSWVVYSTRRMGRGWKLWIQSLTDADDAGRLLEPARAALHGRDMHPRFSPDGRWIVFTSDRGGFMDEFILSGMFPQPYGELFAIPADGSGPAVRLTHDKWEDGLPFWGTTSAVGR